jgi:hypothetical protein
VIKQRSDNVATFPRELTEEYLGHPVGPYNIDAAQIDCSELGAPVTWFAFLLKVNNLIWVWFSGSIFWGFARNGCLGCGSYAKLVARATANTATQWS